MQQTNTWLSFKKSFFLIKTFSSTGQADWWRTNYGENACTKTCSSPMIALLWWQIGQRGNTGMTLDDKDVILSKNGNNSHAVDSSYATSGAFSPSSLGRPTILPDKNINIGQSWVPVFTHHSHLLASCCSLHAFQDPDASLQGNEGHCLSYLLAIIKAYSLEAPWWPRD